MREGTGFPDSQSWFWNLLESSRHNLRTLCRKLEALSREQLLAYQRHYDKAKNEIHPLYSDEFWSYLGDECSEDHADDFAAWAVSQGRKFYENVRSQPDRISEFLTMFETFEADRGFRELRWDEEVDRDEYRGYQRADSIATPIFELHFSEDLEDALRNSQPKEADQEY